jgi:succinoglycan biosynthesis transport protein ExoP
MKALTGSTSGFSAPVMEHRRGLPALVAVLKRRRLVILRTMVVCLALAALACVLTTRRYIAASEIQVQKPAAETLGMAAPGSSGSSDTDAQNAGLTLQTQVTVLQSPAMAMKVMEDLKLENSGEFQKHFNLVTWVSQLFQPPPPLEVQGATLAESPGKRDRMLKTFQDDLDIRIVPGTRVISIAFASSDPNLAAQVVNYLVNSLQTYANQTQTAETSQASKWMETQLAQLKAESDAAQDKLVKLQKETGVVQVAGTTDDGQPQAYSSSVDQYQKATAQLSQAQTNRIQKGAIYEIVKSGNPETIVGLPQNPLLSGAAAGMSGELAVISNLRTQEATVKAQIDEVSAKFGPSYPKVGELKADLASIESSINEEIARLRERARNDYVVAQQIEAGTRRLYDSQRQDASAVNDKTVQYQIAKQQADQARAVYEKLLGSWKEAGALQAFRTNGIAIVSPALAPSEPSQPNVPLYLGTALAAGLLFGCIMAFVVDSMDTKIGDIQRLELQMGQAPFGVLPTYETKKTPMRLSGHTLALAAGEQVPSLKEPHSPYVEALRALRTTLLSSWGGAHPQVLLVTSSTEGEGKSTLSSNLAVILAQQGKRVLLVDADLRRPNLHRIFRCSSDVGLSSILGGEIAPELSPIMRLDTVPGLDILLAGPIPNYSAELLGSSKMESALESWRGQYDFIILDGAPVLPVTDSVVLSSLADATLLVARYQTTQQQSLDRSMGILRAQLGSNRHIGVVLNGVERSANAYYSYYGIKDTAYNGKRVGGNSETS